MDISNISADASVIDKIISGMGNNPSAITEANKILARKIGVPEGLTRIGYTDDFVPPEHKVILEYTVGSASTMKIEALLPPNFNLEIRSNWAQKDAMGLKDVAASVGSTVGTGLKNAGANVFRGKYGRAFNAAGKTAEVLGKIAGSSLSDYAGMSGASLKIMTAHYWQGSSPVSCSIPFEFIAETDPVSQVITPIKELYKMTAPYEELGVIIPPGPSVLGYLTGVGVQINVYIGNILTFKNVIIESVNSEIDTRIDKQNKKIIHAKVDVSITSFFTITRDDIDTLFN